MTRFENTKRDIDTLKESIRRDWEEVSNPNLSVNDRADLKGHINWCIAELKDLLAKLESDVQSPAE